MQDDLAAMMRGASEILTADGCALVGGHSGEGAEAALGFAVNGLVDPAQAWRKSGLRPGDALVLTKPIGTGIVLAGAMRGLAKARWLQAATDSMRRSNAAAARILREYGVVACTDVTGFGLGGHLREMLTASNASATLDPGALKLLPGARELARRAWKVRSPPIIAPRSTCPAIRRCRSWSIPRPPAACSRGSPRRKRAPVSPRCWQPASMPR